MPKAKQTEINYEKLKTELDTILTELQRDNLDVDTALKLYERGLKLTRQLEAYLKTAENKVNELKAQFDSNAL